MANARTFTLPDKVIRFLDSLPSREKSKYVSEVLLRSIEERTQQEALDALRAINPRKSDESSENLLKENREARKDYLNSAHSEDE